MDPKRFTRRLVALGAAMFLCALVFVVTLFDAQIVNGDDYLAQSIRTNAKSETVKASRGVITDRNGKVLVSNRAVYTLNFDSSLVSSDELNDALLRVIDLMNAQGVEIKDTLPLARTSPYAYDTANGSAKTLVKYLVSLKWINEKNVGDDGLPTTLTGSALYLKLRSEYGIDKTLPNSTVRTLIGLRYSLASAKMNGSTTFEFASDVDVSLISLIKDGNYAGVQVDTRPTTPPTSSATPAAFRTGTIIRIRTATRLRAPSASPAWKMRLKTISTAATASALSRSTNPARSPASSTLSSRSPAPPWR